MNSSSNEPGHDEHVVANYYEGYKQTQAEIFSKESKRVRNSIFWIAGLLFGSNLLAFAITGISVTQHLPDLLLFPVIFIALAFLGIKQPMLAVILAAIVFAGIIVLNIIAYGGLGAISGILVKAIIVYFLLAGFQSAKTAERAKKELL